MVFTEWVSYPETNKPESLTIIQNGSQALPNGVYRYYLISKEKPEKKESFSPLTLSFNMVGFSFPDIKKYTQGIKEIVIAYFACYGIDITLESTFLNNPETALLTPVYDGIPLYYPEEERNIIVQELQNIPLGFDLLSSDPLVWFYLRDKNWPIEEWKGMALLPINTEKEFTGGVEEAINTLENVDESSPEGIYTIQRDIFKDETKRFLASMRREGYFAIKGNKELAYHLAQFWEINYFGEFKGYNIFRGKWDLFSLDIPSWFSDSLVRIQLGKLPLFYFGDEYVQYAEPTLINMALLQYAAVRAYVQAGGLHPEEVKVLPNLLIAAPFFSLDEVKKFKEAFNIYLPQIPSWSAEPCPDLEICQERSQVAGFPLVLEIPADVHPYLVVNRGEFKKGTPEKIEIKKGEVPLPDISFKYYASLENTYTFMVNDISLITIVTSDPVQITQDLNKRKQDLLSPWGYKFLIYYPKAPLERVFFLPEEQLVSYI